MQWIFLVFLTSFSILAQNTYTPPKVTESSSDKENHRVYFQTGLGYGILHNANDEIAKDYNTKNGIGYYVLNQGEYVPIQLNENKPHSVYPAQKSKWIPSQNSFEYRYKNQIRLYFENRIFETNSSENTFSYLPTKNVHWGYLNRKTLFFQEERYKVGGAYFFSVADIFSIGLIGNYYAMQQVSSVLTNIELDPRFSSLRFGTKDEKFYGFVPGVALELKLISKMEILYSLEIVNLRSSGSQIYNVSMLPVTYTLDKIENKLAGNFNKLVFIYRPYSWFGLHIGFVRETYNKKYGSDLYISTASIEPSAFITDILISNLILRSNQFSHTLNYAYLQFEFSKGF